MPQTSQNTLPLVEKVKRALLTTQRHSWEQGVAAQAFLELGDDDLVILMAKEAVLRQREDGRLGVVGANHAVTDPAASGAEREITRPNPLAFGHQHGPLDGIAQLPHVARPVVAAYAPERGVAEAANRASE